MDIKLFASELKVMSVLWRDPEGRIIQGFEVLHILWMKVVRTGDRHKKHFLYFSLCQPLSSACKRLINIRMWISYPLLRRIDLLYQHIHYTLNPVFVGRHIFFNFCEAVQHGRMIPVADHLADVRNGG